MGEAGLAREERAIGRPFSGHVEVPGPMALPNAAAGHSVLDCGLLPIALRCRDVEGSGICLGLGSSGMVVARVSKDAAREDQNLVLIGVEVCVPPGRFKHVGKGVGHRLSLALREFEVDHRQAEGCSSVASSTV